MMDRVIFLVDMNAFFISCEMTRMPELRGKPAAVAGDPKKRAGIILAANYEARKYKVKTAMTVNEARRLCPNIVLVPPTHGLYEKKSKEVMDILRRYSPVVQQNSIDEAWMDLTGCEALFGKPQEIAKKIMNDILCELNLWCSIGISENKFLAKMASEMKKPQGITELWQKDIEAKLWNLDVGEMYGIGRKTAPKLNNIGIYKIGDIAKADLKTLIKKFGKHGEKMYELANGIDDSVVSELQNVADKSIGRSTTLSSDITDFEYAKTILMGLAEEVGTEARRYNYKGKAISITIKYNDFKVITRQKTIVPTYLTKDIYRVGIELLNENWNTSKPVRLLGISLSKFRSEDSKQLSIFDIGDELDAGNEKSEKEEKLEKTIDYIRDKFGKDKVKRATLIKDEG